MGKIAFFPSCSGNGSPPDAVAHGLSNETLFSVIVEPQGGACENPYANSVWGISLKIPHDARTVIFPFPWGSHTTPRRGVNISHFTCDGFMFVSKPESPGNKTPAGAFA